MEAIVVIGLLFLAALVVKFLFGKKSVANLPPGPPPKFLIGNLLDLNGDKLHISFTDISQTYGDVISLHTPGSLLVVVNSIEAFRELYEENKYGEKLDGRQRTFFNEVVAGGMDVPLAQNTSGRKLRRTALHTATNHFTQYRGHKLQEEIKHLIELLGGKGDEPQDLTRPIQLYLTNGILAMLTGERYEYDDPRLEVMKERAGCMGYLIRPRIDSVLTMFPWLRHLPFGYGKTYSRYVKLSQKLKKMIYDPAKVSYNPNNVRGGIDQLLMVQKETLGNIATQLTDDHLFLSAMSAIAAGAGPTQGNLLYFIVVILNHPEIAEKLRIEMDTVLGKARLPTLADRSQMAYAEATVLELLRWGSPTPLLVPRRADEEIQFRGYTIPKDTTVITNSWKIHHDEALWKNPWEFRPERFIGPSGRIMSDLQKNVIPFGGGKRKCIGVDLALDLMFLYVTSLVQCFDFKSADPELPNPDPHASSTETAGIKPEAFTVILKHRSK